MLRRSPNFLFFDQLAATTAAVSTLPKSHINMIIPAKPATAQAVTPQQLF